MEIKGFQKITLLDFPGKVACTIFTPGCNFRCPFCHNASLVMRSDEGDSFSEEEIFRYLQKRKGILDGVAVTGGEPMLMKDLPAFLGRVHELGFATKVDTNGSFPDKLRQVIEDGLVDYVAMDIKNSKEKYPATIGVPAVDMAKICESVELLKQNRIPYEFRTTVVKGFHEPEDFTKIGEWISGTPHYYLQAFKDSGDVLGEGCDSFSPDEMEAFAAIVRPYVGEVALRG